MRTAHGRTGERPVLLLFALTAIALPTFCRTSADPKAPRANPAASSIKAMAPAVVQISYRSDIQSPTDRPKVVGTGFIVSKGNYVLTAAHVITASIASERQAKASKIWFFVGVPLDESSVPGVHFEGSFTDISSNIVEVDELHDVALLKLTEDIFSSSFNTGIKIRGKTLKLKAAIAKLKPLMPREGESVLISGYPLSIPTLVTQSGMIASDTYTPIETHPERAPSAVAVPEIEDTILVDAVVNPGNSGGPVYMPGSNFVIGICEAFKWSPLFTSTHKEVSAGTEGILTQNSGLAVVIPIKYAIALLQKNNVHFAGQP